MMRAGVQIKKVAVVGAGTMGLGIAQVFAQGGFDTLLFDLKPELTHAAILIIQKNLQHLVEKSKITASQKDQILSRIKTVDSESEIKADLIVEAIVERLDVKQNLFQKLESINSNNAILATNTSSLSVSQIAQPLKNPGNCIGLHFFNPAPVMKLVEIISGQETGIDLVEEMKSLVLHLEKIPVVTKDSPGFIVNRVARHFYLESLKLLEENKADIEGIDKLMRASGFKLGPFELMDLIGIDTNFAVTVSVYNGFHQAVKFKPNKIQEQKVKAALLGRKSGKGFYEYPKR